MGRKRAAAPIEEPVETPAEEITSEKKSRKLDVDALRNYAKGLDESQADTLTNKIDLFVEADEAKKLASKRLRTTLKAIKTLNGDDEEE
jgi:hydroxypyruvate isomerase